MINTKDPDFKIRFATISDVQLILSFIRELAVYEKLEHEVVVTEAHLKESLFGESKIAEVVLGYYKNEAVSFALFFHNYSTFLGKNGLYLEDLFVKPEFRGKGFGKIMIAFLAKLAVERSCGRFEWWCLDWNEPALKFYRSIGAKPMDDWTVQRLSGKDLMELSNEF